MTSLGVWKEFWSKYVKQCSFLIIVSAFLMVAAALATAASAHIIDPVINKVFIMKQYTRLVGICVVIIGIFFIKSVTTYLYKIIMSVVEAKITSKISYDIFKNIVSLDMSDINSLSTGKVMTYFNNDIRNIKDAVNTVVIGIAKEFFTIVFLVAVMFWKSAELSVISLIGFPIAFIPLIRASRRLRKVTKISQDSIERMNINIQNIFDGIKIVKSACNESKEILKMGKIIDDVAKLQVKTSRIGFIGSPLMEFMGGLAIAIVILYGGSNVIEGKTTAGSFFAFLTALLMLYKPAKSASNFGIVINNARTSLIRIFGLLNTKKLICVSQDLGDKDINLSTPSVEFRNVSFGYKSSENDVINDINLCVKNGQNVALVGNSGGGKSTIAKLLLRFYDVQSGEIVINGKNIKDINIKHLRDNISYVGQDPFLFDDTIIANICYGIRNKSHEEIDNAIRLANADEFINKLHDGVNTKVGHLGNLLSSGQKQRIVIARAILKNAPIIILDEATSALDNTTEKDIQSALHELMKNKTTIIIAHRLSTVVNCDVIYSLVEGKIVESGTHNDLIRNSNSHYYSLWQSGMI